MLQRIAQSRALQQLNQQQPAGDIADAHRLAHAKIHQRTADMPGFLRGDQQHFKTIHTQPGPRKMLHQHHFRPLCNQLARGQHRFVNVRHRMPAEDLQLNQVWRNNIARRQRIAYMKLRDAGRYDTALFR